MLQFLPFQDVLATERTKNIKEAILCYIEDLKKNGEPVPENTSPHIEKVEIAL